MSDKLKIAFVINSLQGGGAERVVSILASNFANSHNVSIITTSSDECSYNIDSKVNLILNKKKEVWFKYLRRIIKLYKILRREKPDVVISMLPGAIIYSIIVCKLLGIKIIISERMDPNQNPKKSLLRRIRNYLYRFSDGLVCQTNDALSYFDFLQINRRIIYNPLSSKLFEKKDFELSYKICIVSRLEEQKNISLGINAFNLILQKIPELQLDIYGVGTLQSSLEEQVEDLNLFCKVSFKGFASNILELYPNYDFLLLPSNYEGLSNSMIEALATGLPVISTNHPIGGAKEFIIDGVNGFLSDVNNAKDLSSNIMRFYSCNYKELSCNSKMIREKLNATIISDQWLKFVLEVISN